VQGSGQRETPGTTEVQPSPDGDAGLERALGGSRRGEGEDCFVVETRWEADAAHGTHPIGAIASTLAEGQEEASVLSGVTAKPPMVFLDLETTGLSGGAGTLAFLVGCGWLDAGGFVTRQYLVSRLADERPVLASVAGILSRAGSLVTFNGKSFDAPVLETRYLYHRLEWAGADLPHLDMLHVARRFWRSEATGDAIAGYDPGCSLVALERHVLGASRRADVPSFEIPSRYFHFVRTGDARPLARVFEHNRLDLLSLAALTSRALSLVRQGPGSAGRAREALALGHLYWRAGLPERACQAYERVLEFDERGAGPEVSLEAVRSLARVFRRSRKYPEAAAYWQRLLDLSHCPPRVASEASEALAIHHEHRLRDYGAAKAYALRSLENLEQVEHNAARPAWREATEYRLARLDRKMASAVPALF
jgi:uncharacterized protein YprB with RNaseH-like and TPR domain